MRFVLFSMCILVNLVEPRESTANDRKIHLELEAVFDRVHRINSPQVEFG